MVIKGKDTTTSNSVLDPCDWLPHLDQEPHPLLVYTIQHHHLHSLVPLPHLFLVLFFLVFWKYKLDSFYCVPLGTSGGGRIHVYNSTFHHQNTVITFTSQ